MKNHIKIALLLAGLVPAGVALANSNGEIAAACSYDQSNPMMASEVQFEPQGCSGTILARADGSTNKTYILTASHCLVNSASEGQSINITVHYLAGGRCVQPGQLLPASDVALATWSGSAKVVVLDPTNGSPPAGHQGKDVALMEIDQAAPAGTYYSGWDTAEYSGQNAISINYSERLQASTVAGPWAVDQFRNASLNYDPAAGGSGGYDAPGASGSGFFSQAGNLIGKLSGGSSSRQIVGGSEFLDFYPELQPYLDPQNTGVTSISGYPAPTPPSITITAAPASITVGQSATVSWSVTHAATCTASSSDPAWAGSKALTGSMTVHPASPGLVTYTLMCSQSGANALSASNSATIYVAQPSSGGGGSAGAGSSGGKSGGGGALGMGLLIPLMFGGLIRRRKAL